ncbi:phosphate/phosphite/phosphonate ABC transporter substrate-binding protein [Sporomusa malonica]|uniref:Phosphonate transport system substrate-binding protein n=1 Tax=Sporomusa malonica TaxID=112901 RepID=A0A1W2DQ31_9FIRM|nr:phosphate/phosphite/phosphonate ABC transporter substrate-binding protein [Sporomusa malonica]SMC99533.1 phosphonate transport system substrate-binding protein [Sporomusa malonica]
MNYKHLTVFLVILLTAAIIILGAYGFHESSKANIADLRPVLRIGAVPVESVAKTRDQFDKLITYLEKKTNWKVELFVSHDYNGIINEMAKGNLDIAWFGPFSYVLAHDRAMARAFAVEDNIRTGTVYHSVIIVHPESPISSVEQLIGRRLAFTDRSSTSGHLIPKAILRQHGVDVEKDMSEVIFTNTHDSAILAVKKRTVDASAVSDAVLFSLREKGIIGEKDYRIIYTSANIPGSVWAYREGINPTLLEKIKHSFLNVAKEDKEALGIYGQDLVKGFVPADDRDYDIIRETAKQLELVAIPR